MLATSFDIFRVEANGVRWLEAAANLEEAKSLVQQIANTAPGEFLLLNQHTGDKTLMKLDGLNSEAHEGTGLVRRDERN
jgi:hypothetical protein